ncbi:MAG: DUF2062 domain-containing protein [Gammaproteobacteria bacterium]|nr:DUF2062 domain-containing protein [Gammaproteobacteria bacterium]
MPKRLLKRFLPEHHVIKEHRHLRFFGTLLHDPNLWHMNRRSVAGAFSVGLFIAFIPVPFQMVFAAAIAIASRVNLPIAASLVWITNPFTMPPLFFLCYKLGAWLLQVPARKIHFEPTLEWLTTELSSIWEPFLLGCLIVATVSAIAGNLLIRGLWRLQVVRSWEARKLRRLGQAPQQ